MKEYKVIVDFYQGRTSKLLYNAMFLIVEESEERAKAWVTNYLRAEDFHNFKVISVEELKK